MFLSNYSDEFNYDIQFDAEALGNIGIVFLIFVLGLLILLALFFIANNRTLNKKSIHYINNSKAKNPNVVDATYTEPVTPQPAYSFQQEVKVEEKPKMTEQEFLTNLYRKKYNGEITDSEFDAALARYRNTKDDYDA